MSVDSPTCSRNTALEAARFGWLSCCSRGRLTQRIADAAHGVDQARLALRLGLATEVADVHLERVGGGREVEAPDLLEDLRARQHLAGVAHQQFEQVELGAGQAHRALAAG